MTALALDHFSRQKIDIAVIETGLGGRLDATNVLEPLLSIITDISFDHREILGPTLEDIATEKGGIIKPGGTALTDRLRRPAALVIRSICKERGANLITVKNTDFVARPAGSALDFDDGYLRITGVVVSLAGSHQLDNAALALKAVSLLKQKGWPIKKSSIKQGLKAVDWPGRFQVLPAIGDKPTVVLDVCHNPAGARAFAKTFKLRFPRRRCRLILGLVKRKDHQAVVDALKPIAGRFLVVPLNTRRSVDVKSFVAELNWHNIPVGFRGSLRSAVNLLLKQTDPDDIIGIVGSHYLVGEYLRNIR